jgi:hypothetical protein
MTAAGAATNCRQACLANGKEYGCSGHRMGGACSNSIRVGRVHAEDVLIGRLRDSLLSPESVRQIASDMQALAIEQDRAQAVRTGEAPQELRELAARIERLRGRLRDGDPDMPADEIQAAIDRAEEKRRELTTQQPTSKQTAKIIAMLPRAAEEARREIMAALGGDSRASLKARVILRAAFDGKITLRPEANGRLRAFWNLRPVALFQRVVPSGSGGTIARYRAFDSIGEIAE